MIIDPTQPDYPDPENPEQSDEETAEDFEPEAAQPTAAGAVAGEGELTCVECGTVYSFTAEQRQEFQARGFQPPKRCNDCRLKRRRKRTAGERPDKRERSGKRPPRQESRQDSDNYGNQAPRPPRQAPPRYEANSYVAQAEAEKARRQTWLSNPGPASFQEDGTPSEDDNFGNSIHYQGPGVDTRFGTAWDGGPNYKPWEGAHGFLLTHHEAEARRREHRRPNKGGGNGPERGDRNDRNGGRSARGGEGGGQRSSSNRRDKHRRRQSFDIVCAECGVATQVPFKPAPDKPVYCRDCYKKSKQAAGNTPPESSSGSSGGSSGSSDGEMSPE